MTNQKNITPVVEIQVISKICSVCGFIQPAHIDYFYRRKDIKDGFGPYCKKCMKANNKKRYKDNREHVLSVVKNYASENRDRKIQYNKEYYTKNRDKLIADNSAYYKKNKIEIDKHREEYLNSPEQKRLKREYNKKYNVDNKKRISANKKEYQKQEYVKNRRSEYGKTYHSSPVNRKRRNAQQRLRYRTSPTTRLNEAMSKGIRQSLKHKGGSKEGFSWTQLVDYTVDQLEVSLRKTIPDGYTWEDYMSGKLHMDHKLPKNKFNFEKYSDEDFKRCWELKNLQLLPAKENISKSDNLEKPLQMSLIF